MSSGSVAEDDLSGAQAPRKELSRNAVEVVVGLLVGMAIWVLPDSYARGAGWDTGSHSGFFLALCGCLLLVAAGFGLVSALRRSDAIGIISTQLMQVDRVFVPLILYVIAIAYLGISVASALFIAVVLTLGFFRQ